MALSTGNVTSDGGYRTGGRTFSHNSNGTLLLVSQHIRYGTGTSAATAITYNGVGLTKLANQNSTSDSVHLWYLKSPASGANNVVATFAGEGAMVFTAVSVIDADLVTTFGTVAKAGGTSTAPSATASSASGEMVLAFVGHSYAGGAATLTVGASQTEIANAESGSTGLYGRSAVSWEAGAASVTMSWTASTSSVWALVSVPVKPVGGGGPTATRRDGITKGLHRGLAA